MASDAFSFAYVLFELLTWQLPWAGVQPFLVRPVVGGPPHHGGSRVPGAHAASCQLPMHQPALT